MCVLIVSGSTELHSANLSQDVNGADLSITPALVIVQINRLKLPLQTQQSLCFTTCHWKHCGTIYYSKSSCRTVKYSTNSFSTRYPATQQCYTLQGWLLIENCCCYCKFRKPSVPCSHPLWWGCPEIVAASPVPQHYSHQLTDEYHCCRRHSSEAWHSLSLMIEMTFLYLSSLYQTLQLHCRSIVEADSRSRKTFLSPLWSSRASYKQLCDILASWSGLLLAYCTGQSCAWKWPQRSRI